MQGSPLLPTTRLHPPTFVSPSQRPLPHPSFPSPPTLLLTPCSRPPLPPAHTRTAAPCSLRERYAYFLAEPCVRQLCEGAAACATVELAAWPERIAEHWQLLPIR